MTTQRLEVLEQPVALAEAKLWLKVDHSHEDALIESLIASATDMAEQATGRAIARSRYELRLDAFPKDKAIRLLWPTVESVEAVRYIDDNADLQTVPVADYGLDSQSEPAWLLPVANWPAAADTFNAVRVTYLAGYGQDCPESIRQWVLLHISNWYRNREATTVGTAVREMPFVSGLLDRYRVWSL